MPTTQRGSYRCQKKTSDDYTTCHFQLGGWIGDGELSGFLKKTEASVFSECGRPIRALKSRLVGSASSKEVFPPRVCDRVAGLTLLVGAALVKRHIEAVLPVLCQIDSPAAAPPLIGIHSIVLSV